MPPDGYNAITVPKEVFEQLIDIIVEYECDSIPDAVATASAVALERDESDLARILAQRLAE